jgi:hypothetical protein
MALIDAHTVVGWWPEEGAHSPSDPNGLLIIIILKPKA